MGLIREEEGVAAQVLENLGVRLDIVREEVISLLGEGQPGPAAAADRPRAPARTKSKTPTLDEFGRDLTVDGARTTSSTRSSAAPMRSSA